MTANRVEPGLWYIDSSSGLAPSGRQTRRLAMRMVASCLALLSCNELCASHCVARRQSTAVHETLLFHNECDACMHETLSLPRLHDWSARHEAQMTREQSRRLTIVLAADERSLHVSAQPTRTDCRNCTALTAAGTARTAVARACLPH